MSKHQTMGPEFDIIMECGLNNIIFPVQVPGGIWNYVDLDMCQFGMQYRKSTRLLTLQFNLFEDEGESFLSPLGKRCRGGHQHVTLSGWGHNGPKRPTRGTAEYPKRLASEWAEAAGAHMVRYY